MKRFKSTALAAVACCWLCEAVLVQSAWAVIISPRDALLKRMLSVTLRILIAQWR
jgi:hypothetical protein